jgi:uncharacterized membrane protein
LKKYLIAGLLVWLPLAVTIWVLQAVLGMLDGMFAWLLSGTQIVLPAAAHASIEKLRHVPGLGVVVVLLGLLLTGIFATNIVGQWSLRQGHRILSKIPIVKSIYSSVQQVSDTLFSSSGNAFREAVLVQYPRAGTWTIAFVTGRPGGAPARTPRILERSDENDVLRPDERSAARPDGHADGLGASAPRPRRRDLHRPARP